MSLREPSVHPCHPWQDALTRRLRTLIRTAPLHRVEASKGHRGSHFSEQDLRALALRVLDLVIEKMGLGSGATFEELREELRPLIRSVVADPNGLDTDGIADAVVLALLNEPDRRQAFAEPYLQVSTEETTRKVLQFHLLREREVADGTTAIVATVEGINLYAGMLDYPVEDAQIAEEAVLHAQVQRGRIDEAVRTASRARLRSIELEQKILNLLDTVRRDVGQVDWLGEVLGMLDDARRHVGERLDAERAIHQAVEQRLDAVLDESGRQLVGLRDTLVECIERHARLHERLIGANETYLVEQDRQAFRPRVAALLPDLEAEVLRAAVALPTGALAALTEPLLARLQPPRPPPTLRLAALVDRLLAPRRAEGEEAYEVAWPELERLPAPVSHFSPVDDEAVSRLLAAAPLPSPLSELLAQAHRLGLSRPAVHLLALRVLRAFDPLASGGDALQVQRTGHPLHDVVLDGDDLHVMRSAEDAP